MALSGFESGQGKTDVLGENTLPVHYAHHKSHMALSGFESGQGKTDVLGENTLPVHSAHHESHMDLSGFSTRSPFVTLSRRAQSGR